MINFSFKGGFMAADEHEVLENYITQHNLKITKQRRAVLEAFLGSEEHLSAEELYKMVSVKRAQDRPRHRLSNPLPIDRKRTCRRIEFR